MTPGGAQSGSDGQAQLILLGAIVLGVILVGIALVLNSAIFAENLATRQNSQGASDMESFRESARVGTGEAIAVANRDHAGSSFTTLRDSHYNPSVRALEDQLANSEALGGASIGVATDGSRRGTQLVDGDATTDLTPRGGSPVDWSVAPDSHVRAFEVTVDPSSAAKTSDVTNQLGGGTPVTFVVTLESASGTGHDIAIYEDSDDGVVRVLVSEVGESGYRECDATGGAATVSLTGRPTVDGSYCAALDPVADATGTYDVRFAASDLATGTYRLVVDRADGPLDEQVDRANYGDACSGTTYADTTGDHPHSVPAIYAGTVDLRYRDGQVASESEVRVAPAQAGDALTTPLVRSLTVTDTSDDSGSGPAAFDIDWKVSDPDGDLTEVTVEARNIDDGTTHTDTVSVSGTDATGSFSFSDSDDSGDQYDLTVTVTDGTHSRSRTVRHTADGDDTECSP